MSNVHKLLLLLLLFYISSQTKAKAIVVKFHNHIKNNNNSMRNLATSFLIFCFYIFRALPHRHLFAGKCLQTQNQTQWQRPTLLHFCQKYKKINLKAIKVCIDRHTDGRTDTTGFLNERKAEKQRDSKQRNMKLPLVLAPQLMHCYLRIFSDSDSCYILTLCWSTGSAAQCNNARCGSQSSQVSQSSGDICRICHCESDPQNPLLTPCYCSGSLKYVHQTCLQQWLTASETNFCELCKFPFIMHTKIKPLHEWRSLDISGIERRRLCCSALFHCAAALCVIWSLCVLIERAADDVQHGHIDWPFWTKLAVVTVGLTGGVIFMYIQCKAYLHLCHRWKARNRILLIQNAPEKINPYPQTSPRPTTQQQLQQQQQHQQQQHLHCEQNNDARNAAGVIERLVNESQSNGQRNLARLNLSNASAAGLHGRDALEEKMQETDSLFRHERVPYNERLLQDLENDVDSLMAATTRSSSSNLYRTNISTGCGSGIGVPEHHAGQVAVSANIECSQSQHNYERDWALDDVVSQISSFRPCPQGSGSMTPFHDSIHNVLEHNSRTSSCVSVNEGDNESDHLAHECKANHMPNSYDVTASEAVPVLGGSLGSSELDGFLPRQMNNVPADINNLNTNIRRHSDTKLLDEDVQYQPVIYVDMNNASSASDNEQMCRLLCQTPGIAAEATTTTTTSLDNNSTVLDMNMLSGSGTASTRMPQKLLAQNLDNRNRREQHLMWQQQENNNNNNRGRRIFKSLPNLSRSNENRFKK